MEASSIGTVWHTHICEDTEAGTARLKMKGDHPPPPLVQHNLLFRWKNNEQLSRISPCYSDGEEESDGERETE